MNMISFFEILKNVLLSSVKRMENILANPQFVHAKIPLPLFPQRTVRTTMSKWINDVFLGAFVCAKPQEDPHLVLIQLH